MIILSYSAYETWIVPLFCCDLPNTYFVCAYNAGIINWGKHDGNCFLIGFVTYSVNDCLLLLLFMVAVSASDIV